MLLLYLCVIKNKYSLRWAYLYNKSIKHIIKLFIEIIKIL